MLLVVLYAPPITVVIGAIGWACFEIFFFIVVVGWGSVPFFSSLFSLVFRSWRVEEQQSKDVENNCPACKCDCLAFDFDI